VVHFYICSVELYGLATKVLLSAIFLKTINRFWNAKSDPKFGHRGEGVSYIDARKKKEVLECHSSLCPSKKLPEWCSSMFCHKNTPGYIL
jgi:hypothetical protein